ncbi:YciI family protein [Actinotalea ferrariae]|nr:YciI family protein [Actinotalea ferrariae]
MLLMSYEEIHGVPPIDRWDRADIAAHVAFQQRLGQELASRGELVGGEGLAQPQNAKLVTSDGKNPPVIRDWPFEGDRPHLAGYWTVDVESEERALQIAGQLSAAPGPHGTPIRQPIEVRAVVGPGG